MTNLEKIEVVRYKMKVAEHYMDKLHWGLSVYQEGIEQVPDAIKKYEYREKCENLALELKNTVTHYKQAVAQYNKLIEDDETLAPESIEKAIEIGDELAKNEIYGSIGIKAQNVELPLIVNKLKEYRDLISLRIKQLKSSDSVLAKIEAYELTVKLVTLEKRIAERELYYTETFLPMYNRDMNECRKYLKAYLDRAKVFANSKIDIGLTAMISEHEKRGNEGENLWLFYTALRNRVDKCITQLNERKADIPRQFHNYLIPVRK